MAKMAAVIIENAFIFSDRIGFANPKGKKNAAHRKSKKIE